MCRESGLCDLCYAGKCILLVVLAICTAKESRVYDLGYSDNCMLPHFSCPCPCVRAGWPGCWKLSERFFLYLRRPDQNSKQRLVHASTKVVTTKRCQKVIFESQFRYKFSAKNPAVRRGTRIRLVMSMYRQKLVRLVSRTLSLPSMSFN